MSGRHLAARRRHLVRAAAAVLGVAAIAALTTGSVDPSTSATYADIAGGQFRVAAGEWCPSVVSTQDGPVVFERATGLPTEHVHVMCSPSDTYRAYWQSDGNVVVYRMSPWTAVTAAASGGSDGLVLGTDGNLVISLAGVPMRSTG
ncbi:MAG: hypothetical protein HGA44_05750, partial [Cellulomonadaceae bacterium]|nr:hypothetical protein [Cellulomonadaceae bacterium]